MISNPAYINEIGRSRGVDIREGSLYCYEDAKLKYVIDTNTLLPILRILAWRAMQSPQN